jgi:omega-6 fatty acid desaturase (delta-12 desaturase)
MLADKQLILATKTYAKEDRSRSWKELTITLSLLVVLFLFTLWVPFVLAKIAGSILFALMMVRTFIIYHDYLHHTMLNKSGLANVLMTLFGIYILAPKSIWKRSHDHHHKHNSKLFSASIGSYPIATREKFLSMSRGERRAYLAIRHPLTIAAGYLTIFMVGMSTASFISSPRRHFDSLIALLLHAAGSVAIFWFFGWQAWVFCIVIPFTIACGLGSYLFYAQHNFPGVTFYANKDWAYEKAALESSSYMEMSALMHWFTGNIGYHHIHHLNSRIPFYRLPEAMAGIKELQRAKVTSLAPSDVIACLKLKVWDSQQGKMIGVKNLVATAPVTMPLGEVSI